MTRARSCHYPLSRKEAKGRHTAGTAAAKAEEGAGYDRSVYPEWSGLHAGYSGWDNGLPTSREDGNLLNPALVRIEGCNSPS